MELLRHRTVRMRLTAVYGGLFVLMSAGLLAIFNGMFATQVSTEYPPAQASYASLLKISVIALGTITLVSLTLAWLIAGRALRPLRAMTETTRRISAESLHERLAMAGPRDELTGLAGTINDLLERLEGSFAAQRRFAANAAHELRTPLATIRTSLDVAVAKPAPVPVAVVADRLYEQLDQVERLLDGLLVLARAQHGDLPGTTVLSLDAVAAASLAARADAITARNLTVSHASDPAGARVAGSAELIRRMVDNVLDNAIIHNDDGGLIQVSTASHQAVACLVVDNGGGVLDPGLARELARPFRRLGADRTRSDRGAGLGLSIVAAIAAAHHGTLELLPRPEGGLRVRIGLPSA
jgi:signal transduction histidine kinase